MPQAEPRYEIKMVCAATAAPGVVAEMQLSSFGVRTLFPPRLVQSIYFDTHEGHAVAENLAGVSEREKIRFRWYGPQTRAVRGQLECKRRVNMLGTKDVAKIDAPLDIEGCTRVELVRVLRAHATAAWRERLSGCLEPVQWIRYRREYLRSADGRIRITLDRDLQTFDLRDRWVLSPTRPTPTPSVLIVECKAAASDRRRIEELVQQLPLLVDKCSKFVIASAPGHAPIVSDPAW